MGKINTENDLRLVVNGSNCEYLVDEVCCTCMNIILKNDGQIMTSFLGAHNPDIVKTLEKAQKAYFKELKKTLKKKYFEKDNTHTECTCGDDCKCTPDNHCGCGGHHHEESHACNCGCEEHSKDKKHKSDECCCGTSHSKDECNCGCNHDKSDVKTTNKKPSTNKTTTKSSTAKKSNSNTNTKKSTQKKTTK